MKPAGWHVCQVFPWPYIAPPPLLMCCIWPTLAHLSLFLSDIILAFNNILLLSFGSTSHVVASSRMVFHSLSYLPMGWCKMWYLVRNVPDIVQGLETLVHPCSYAVYSNHITLPFYQCLHGGPSHLSCGLGSSPCLWIVCTFLPLGRVHALSQVFNHQS